MQRRELLHQDQEQEIHALQNEDDFHVPFLGLFLIDCHLLINCPKLWNEFSFSEIQSTAHKLIFNQK